MSSSPSHDRTDFPSEVGPYRIEDRIGSGGMGEVFRAYDARLDRRVALKQIKPAAARHAQLRKRFLREARAAAKLGHPTVVQVHDILFHDGCDWIVMELAEGRSLRDVLRTGPLSLAFTLELAVELASGLTFAHEYGIVHRDLKSDNVVLTPQGRAKILDFGLAKDIFVDESSVSKIGQLLGTPRCMSPEQATGQPVDHRSDLFSFGVLLYEMLTGQSPFGAPSPLQSVAKVCSHDPPPPSSLRPEVPASLDRLVLWLLEKEKERRPARARIVLGEVQRIAGEHFRRTGEESAGSGYTATFLPPDGGTVPDLDDLGTETAREGRWRRLAGVSAAVVLAMTVLGLSWWSLRIEPEGASGSTGGDLSAGGRPAAERSKDPGAAAGRASAREPGGTAAGNAAPGSRIQGSVIQGSTTPGSVIPGSTTPGSTSPGGTSPGSATRDGAVRASVAVLPFADEGSGERPFFADAVADELAQRLPDVPDLRVVARWSTEEYADRAKTPREVGQELAVSHLLRGRVFWGRLPEGGDTVRVEVELVRCSDGALVWSATFARDVEDLFEAQAQISERVVREVSRALSIPLGFSGA